ncbi:dipicolinate synthase subunit B [Fuchsiella alkaliacetigena]|uniref:dipicolinate synthase subunit B n=1 Tax=Fuchsiella alkaliacetigena TaxID=957042 RepID=UPI00200AE7BC|nr:dipicolinate synthase subunit B [Fuchsiella alkaliacetigena]MCK8823486.1 dipicolinate synthase subunit B [Fuchsiella alkaliacetigena]
MELKGKKIGFAFTGSYCTLDRVIPSLERLVEVGAIVYPIFSESIQKRDTKFGTAASWEEKVIKITGNEPMTNLIEVEPIGPEKFLDILIVAPCTGNTMAKIANGITDTTVSMAVKAHLRNDKPIILAIATNDGLGNNAENLGKLLNTKNIYFVPFGQDNPSQKINSLISRMDLIEESLKLALEEKQIQPVLIEYKGF